MYVILLLECAKKISASCLFSLQSGSLPPSNFPAGYMSKTGEQVFSAFISKGVKWNDIDGSGCSYGYLELIYSNTTLNVTWKHLLKRSLPSPPNWGFMFIFLEGQ